MVRDKTGVLAVRFISFVSLRFMREDEMNKAGVEYTWNLMRTLSLLLLPGEIDRDDNVSTIEGGMLTWARTFVSEVSISAVLSRLMLEVLRSSMLLPDTEKTSPCVTSLVGTF